MTAARIIGETFTAAGAVAPEGSALGTELVSWTAGDPDSGGLLDLGSWLTYTCATAETSARTGAATVTTGFAADAPRGYSEDGATWGLLVEPAATNRQGEQDITAWDAVGPPIFTAVTAPNGELDGWKAEDFSAVAFEYTRDLDELGICPGAVTLSVWIADITSVRADVYTSESGGVGTMAGIAQAGPTSSWTYYTDSYSGSAPTTSCETVFVPAGGTGVSDTGAASIWGVQVEDRQYPTSFIGADNATFVRAAGTLTAPSSSTTEGGYFDVEIEFAPQFASDETGADYVLLYIDANDFLYFSSSSRSIVLILDSTVVVVSSALTFARGDVLTIRAQHRPDRAAVTVTGASVGDSETVVAAVLPLTMPGTLTLCGGASGATEGVILYGVTFYHPIDGSYRLPGWMRLDESEPVGADGLAIDVGDRVAIAAEAVAPDGLLRVTMTWRPMASDSDADTLLWLGDATLTYDPIAGAIVWTVDDGIVAAQSIQSSPLTFSSGDTIVVELEHDDNRRRLTVDGVAVTGDPIPALVMPSEGYVLSDPDGSLYGGALVSFEPHLQTFAELADDRTLVQMGPSFRSLVQELVQERARTYDALAGIKAAFDVEHAVGTQLDVIGSIVGLPREGFTDARYSVFLGIQIELLLAAARENGEWTGTCENILRIVRHFVGAAAPAITLRNAPPYSYAITIEGLDLDEAWLLVRFLRTASHAGVLGLVVIPLDDDSLWDSDSVSVTSGGIWDSDSVAVTDPMVWGTAVSTE